MTTSFAARLVPTLGLALQLARRDLRNRYLGSFSGGAWALLQPLVQLAVYTFVFGYIFRQRLPGADAPGYVPFLVVVLWPWTAFAEAVSRATTAIQDNASLIGKVALPRAALVFAPVIASFAIHGIGYLGLLLILLIVGAGIAPSGLILMLPALALLFLFALGLALLLSALQVFVRDIAPALPQLLMLWMFLSPVFYGRYVMPETVRPWFDANPMTGFAEYLRYALLGTPPPGMVALAVSVTAVALALSAGLFTFRRLQRHFEDFL
ncbi:MAG TPA: ABC transporter permease [Tahibacter sp.]|uniref:ABC transporter permease n=1 Tax=Tahibacter sp. TaxID=2056211 RepID=UPI002CD4016C|nr:ABC transporter permease [Tahibacter sp.]HSX58677.1 ABC transporter permease [Tahibacter sp.]